MLLGLTGRLKSGKDTAAQTLIKNHGFTRYALADILKEVCAEALGREELGWTGTDWTGPKTDLARRVLQGIGEGARLKIGPDVWIDALERAIAENGHTRGDVVVSDVRHPNEEAWIHRRGGLLIRINRPGIDRSGRAHQHPSETNVDNLKADVDIVNDGTIERLWDQVDAIVRVARALRGQAA